jgi:hypothetical protein
MARIAAVALVLGCALCAALPSPASAYTAFWNPPRTVGCVIDAGYARCDARRPGWPVPPKPPRCLTEYGQGAAITWLGPAGLVCADDTALLARPGRILPYGKVVRFGRLGCKSTRRYVVCQNLRSGHGFRMSRSRYRLF